VSVLIGWSGLVLGLDIGLGLGLILLLIRLQLGWGRKIVPFIYVCPSQTENNTEHTVQPLAC